MISRPEVKEVNVKGQIGFQICALYRDCSDSFYEPIVHAAIFPNRERAEKFLKRAIRRKSPWEYDFSQWGVSPSCGLSNSCAIQFYAPIYSVL